MGQQCFSQYYLVFNRWHFTQTASNKTKATSTVCFFLLLLGCRHCEKPLLLKSHESNKINPACWLQFHRALPYSSLIPTLSCFSGAAEPGEQREGAPRPLHGHFHACGGAGRLHRAHPNQRGEDAGLRGQVEREVQVGGEVQEEEPAAAAVLLLLPAVEVLLVEQSIKKKRNPYLS